MLTRSRPVNGPDGRLELAELFLRVAETLERSAHLAEQHAEREQTSGRSDAAGAELERAMWAREAARRGRRTRLAAGIGPAGDVSRRA